MNVACLQETTLSLVSCSCKVTLTVDTPGGGGYGKTDGTITEPSPFASDAEEAVHPRANGSVAAYQTTQNTN